MKSYSKKSSLRHGTQNEKIIIQDPGEYEVELPTHSELIIA